MLSKIIAREGLLLIVLAVLLHVVLYFCRAVPPALPEYKVQFADGKTYTIVIHPDINYSKAFRSGVLLKEIHDPPSQLVSRRIEEFARQAKIHSKMTNAACINSRQLRLSENFSRILLQPFIVKIAFLYILLLFIRFVIWAIKTLKS
jgi:hypothetical protein